MPGLVSVATITCITVSITAVIAIAVRVASVSIVSVSIITIRSPSITIDGIVYGIEERCTLYSGEKHGGDENKT